tara:strand:+ start:715 stop:1272 length:558 start_codon:yes stop_codon:yes gene_type:complete
MNDFFRQIKEGSYIGNLVYGANDGIVTTFAIVAGATGALLSPGIIVILGIANLLADGFSMGASNFLAVRSEQEMEKRRSKEQGEYVAEKNAHDAAKDGMVTFFAFIIAGIFPLLPYLVGVPTQYQFGVSAVLAAITFFAVGAARTIVTKGNVLKTGLEMLLVGSIAATVAYVIGWGVKILFNIVI